MRNSTNTISGCESAIIWQKFAAVSCAGGLLASSVGSSASGFFASGSSVVLPALYAAWARLIAVGMIESKGSAHPAVPSAIAVARIATSTADPLAFGIARRKDFRLLPTNSPNRP